MLSNTDWIKNTFLRSKPSLIGHRYGMQWTGDIDGDGKIMLSDVLLLLKAIVNETQCNGDINNDNRISLLDALAMLRAAVI